MLRAALFSLVAAVVIPTHTIQVPLSWADPRQADSQCLGNEEWSLDKLPNPNDTEHLVFETVHSLLQLWPNARMRNGHNIAPGRIPKGTLLYRGTTSKELPPGPEWVATDPEHSYLFCQNFGPHIEQGCWHLTLATTRSLKVVYFDGSSAAKLPYGSMDTQNLLAWGGSDGHDTWDEAQRIQDLCNWGKDFGVDGFVRMNIDFEVMLCDFISGVSVVSFANLASRGHGPAFGSDFLSFEAMHAGSWHNHFPGETRIQLDLAGLVSFYDTQLVPSLVDVRAGRERWHHRVQNISGADWSAAKSRLEANLVRPEGTSSGIDWKTLVHVIADRYAGRLELIRHLLHSRVTTTDEILDLANKTQTQLRIVLTPYLLLSAIPVNQSDKDDLDWVIPIYQLCATTHTYSMGSEIELMTDSEKGLLRAVRGTTREICRTITRMWAAGVHAGVDPSSNTNYSPDIVKATHLLDTWAEDLGRLITWLDWNMWIKCNPDCDPEEMCWLPTWPAGFPKSPFPPDPEESYPETHIRFDFRAMVLKRLAKEFKLIGKRGPNDWIRPEPRCIRRVDPYDF